MKPSQPSRRDRLIEKLLVGMRDAEAGRIKLFDQSIVDRVKRTGRDRRASRAAEQGSADPSGDASRGRGGA